MTNKELKQYLLEMTFVELKGKVEHEQEAVERAKVQIQEIAKGIQELDMEDPRYFRKLSDSISSLNLRKADVKWFENFMKIATPILEKKKQDKEDTESILKFEKAFADKFQVVDEKIEELKAESKAFYQQQPELKITDEDVEHSFRIMRWELLVILQDKLGDIESVGHISTNGNRGFDGRYMNSKGRILYVNTILAGGFNIQKLHFRTLTHVMQG